MTLKKMKNWEVFEHEVRMLVEAFGYHAETTQPSHDYGVDVIAENQRRRVIIQCKLYGSGRIGGDTIMQLIGSREFFNATDAICITTSYFTKQAREIADKRNVHLVDREILLGLCREKNLTIPSMTTLQIDQGRAMQINGTHFTIGRADDNDLVLPAPQVSRHHAALSREGLQLLAHDCGSANGTVVNGCSIVKPTRLNYGSKIDIGVYCMEIVFKTLEKVNAS